MHARFALPALLAPALLLSACGTYNGGVDSIHQPVVQRNDYVFDVRTSGYGLAAGEPQRVAGWMQSLGLRYGDRVSVDDGGSGDATLRQQIAAEAGRYGILLEPQAPVTTGAIAAGTARVIVTRMTASVPGCPDHSRGNGSDLFASTSSNFGCAINSNIAAMVADPGDLVRGQPGTTATDPATATKAIRVLQATPPTGAGGLRIERAPGAVGGSD